MTNGAVRTVRWSVAVLVAEALLVWLVWHTVTAALVAVGLLSVARVLWVAIR